MLDVIAQSAPVRLLLVAALVIAAFAAGFVKGALWQADKAADFKIEVRAAGEKQAVRTQNLNAKNQTITQETHDAHTTGIALVRDYYDHGVGLRQPHADCGTLPITAEDSAESRPGSADAGTAAAEPAPGLALARHCAETTLMFIDLRNAWRRHLAAEAAEPAP